MRSLGRAVIATALIVLGLLSTAFGGVVFLSIPRSDTATGSLVVFALEFLIPGLAAVAVGAWLLRRNHQGSRGFVAR